MNAVSHLRALLGIALLGLVNGVLWTWSKVTGKKYELFGGPQ